MIGLSLVTHTMPDNQDPEGRKPKKLIRESDLAHPEAFGMPENQDPEGRKPKKPIRESDLAHPEAFGRGETPAAISKVVSTPLLSSRTSNGY
jgi:hypothetical protein